MISKINVTKPGESLGSLVEGYLAELLGVDVKMTIEKSDLEELKKIYFKNYKVKITDEQVSRLGVRLINLFKVVAKPIPVDANFEKEDN